MKVVEVEEFYVDHMMKNTNTVKVHTEVKHLLKADVRLAVVDDIRGGPVLNIAGPWETSWTKPFVLCRF